MKMMFGFVSEAKRAGQAKVETAPKINAAFTSPGRDGFIFIDLIMWI
jgi:hypothetical protein